MIYSYFSTHTMAIKQRWYGMTIFKIFQTEYKSRSSEYYKNAILSGAILVNNKKVDLEYFVHPSDIIYHLIHLHEPKCPEIEIISEEDDLVVVNKPSGVACHPTGGYFFYSVTQKLSYFGNLSCINRLDIPTSGVLILAKNNPKIFHHLLKERLVEKVYLALVKGEFMNTTVEKPLLARNGGNVSVDYEKGKYSKTEFIKLKYNGIFSLVECRPFTGRQHQIRVHLQSIGFPIVNDVLYGDGIHVNLSEFFSSHDSHKNTAVLDGETKYLYNKENNLENANKNDVFSMNTKKNNINDEETRENLDNRWATIVSHGKGKSQEAETILETQKFIYNNDLAANRIHNLQNSMDSVITSYERKKLKHMSNKNHKSLLITETSEKTTESRKIRMDVEQKEFKCDGSENINKMKIIANLLNQKNSKKRNKELIVDMKISEEAKKFAIQNCEGVNNRVFKNKTNFLCLHAYKYTIESKTYTSFPPFWENI